MQNFPNSSALYDLLMKVLTKPTPPGEPPPLDKAPDQPPPPVPPYK